ncbi:unnamed protein product [Leptosia nina]|uniref:Uncharacterized protein n=1 Tax=Leptosia nina TaxID=320188 RepID=A0AAV1JUH9_9NEOP
MKAFILVAVFLGAVTADVIFYTTADDNLNMQAVVDDPVKLQSYVDCFLDRKPCDPIPASYKEIIPDSIETGCKRCNPAQKRLANTFLIGLKKKLPKEYQRFLAKYDPTGKFIEKFLQRVEGHW